MKKPKIAVLILCCSMLFSSCDSPEQKAENEKNLKQAELNSIAYIEEKYGFTPKITESVLGRKAGLFASEPSTDAIVMMTYNEKEFSVYIDGETKNTNGADNYQQKELISALTARINEVAPQIKSLDIRGGIGLSVSSNFYKCDFDNLNNLYSEYFDGSNFIEVFGDGSNPCSITADYVDVDFADLDEADFDFLPISKQFEINMLSYRTESDYVNKPNYSEFTDYTSIKKYAILIEESLSFRKDNIKHNQYTLGQCDNFYYYVSDNEPKTVNFSETSLPDVLNWSGNGVVDGRFVTPAYRLNSAVNERLYIYYPLSELPEKARLATYSKTDEGEKFKVSPITENIGNYKMVYLQAKEFNDINSDDNQICFTFITEKENVNNEQ